MEIKLIFLMDVFLYCIIFTSSIFFLFNLYKIFEKNKKSEKETDPVFINIFNNLKNQIINSPNHIELYTHDKLITLFCGCENTQKEIKIHIHKSIKKDSSLFKSIVAHELFHAKDLISGAQFYNPLEKELLTDLRAAKIVGKSEYIKMLNYLSTKWYARQGESHPDWHKRIINIERLVSYDK